MPKQWEPTRMCTIWVIRCAKCIEQLDVHQVVHRDLRVQDNNDSMRMAMRSTKEYLSLRNLTARMSELNLSSAMHLILLSSQIITWLSALKKEKKYCVCWKTGTGTSSHQCDDVASVEHFNDSNAARSKAWVTWERRKQRHTSSKYLRIRRYIEDSESWCCSAGEAAYFQFRLWEL